MSRTTISLSTRHHYLASLPPLAFIFLVLALLYLDKNENVRCKDLLMTGRWSSNIGKHNSRRGWHAYGSLVHHYSGQEIYTCLQNQTLHLSGDSTIRQIFWAIAEILGGEDGRAAKVRAEKHQDLTFTKDDASLSFLWDPFLNRSDTLRKIGHPSGNMLGILLSTGLWQARFSGDNYLQATESSLNDVVKWLTTRKSNTSPFSSCYRDGCTPVIVVPPPALQFDLLSAERAETMTAQSMHDIKGAFERVSQHGQVEVAWSTYLTTVDNLYAMDESGLHVTSEIALLQADVLLNRLCNRRTMTGHEAAAHACTGTVDRYFKECFAIACVFFAGCTMLAKMLGQSSLRNSSNIQAMITLIAIAFYCVLTDRTSLFGKSNKIVSQSLFVFSSCFFLSLALCSTKRGRKIFSALPSPGTQIETKPQRLEFLSRSQTDEWKGWMQIVILLYHYFGMSKVLWVYQLVRVLVGSYLFLTGYGHATYFQATRDFSARRIVTVLVRLNMLSVVLAYVMSNTYDFYYFPGLASFWVLVTYLTFWNCSEKERAVYCVMRILTSLAVLTIVLSNEHAIIVLTQIVRAGYGPSLNPKELMFRIKLDLYAPYLGMATSMLVHHSDEFLESFVSLRGACVASIRQILLINFALLLLLSYLAMARLSPDKFSYNHWHSILSILPMTAYMILRNASEGLRSCEVPILRWIGTISLELFVLQYHTWLAADTKGILQPGIIDVPSMTRGKTVAGSWEFWLDTAFVTVIFVWLSDACARATNVVTRWFVRVDDNSDEAEQRRTVLTRVFISLSALWLLNVIVQTGLG